MPLKYFIPRIQSLLADIEEEEEKIKRLIPPPKEGLGLWGRPLPKSPFELYKQLTPPQGWQQGLREAMVPPWEAMGRIMAAEISGPPEISVGTPKFKPEAVEEFHEKYTGLPWYGKMGYEAPFWLATAGLGKIAGATRLARLPKPIRALTGIEKPRPTSAQIGKYMPTARTLLGKAPPVAKISKTAIARPDIVDDITSKIKSWRRGVAGTKALRGPEYTKRFQEYANLTDDFLRKHPGDIDGATRYAKSALRGKYPEATFNLPTFTKAEVDNLRLYGRQQVIETAKDYGRLGHRIGIDENNLDSALIRVFVEGKPPREFELKLFTRAFGGEFTRTLANLRRTLGDKVFSNFIDIANFPRAVLASFDVSAPMRQGWILFAKHPVKGFQSMKSMFKALRSEKNAQLIDDIIRARPETQKGLESGLEITRRAGTQVGRGLKAMAAREESFMSRFAGKVPGIRMSERAYVTFLNDMRSRVWEGYAPMLRKLGADDATYRGLATLINMASGRGDLGKLRLISPLLNNMFFSPRLVLSRLELPGMLMHRNPIVRKEAWKMFISFMGLNTAIVSGLYLGGARVGLDPRSGEFGKVRIGNTRLDFWAGFVQWARFFPQFITAKRKLQGGEIVEVNRRQLLMRMAQSKFSPMMGFLWDLMEGQTYMGEEVIPRDKPELARQARNRLAPLFIQDMWDAIEDMGPEGIPLALPGAFGVGVITYEQERRTPLSPGGFKGGAFRGGGFKSPFD